MSSLLYIKVGIIYWFIERTWTLHVRYRLSLLLQSSWQPFQVLSPKVKARQESDFYFCAQERTWTLRVQYPNWLFCFVPHKLPQSGFKSSRKAHLVLYFLGAIKTKARFRGLLFYIVPRRGLEPPRVSPHAPQAGLATSYSTWASTWFPSGDIMHVIQRFCKL